MIYAVIDELPTAHAVDGMTYLTAGKKYPVMEEFGNLFSIVDDGGAKIHCLWHGCAHIDFGDWTRIERESTAPADDVVAELAAALRNALAQFRPGWSNGDAGEAVRIMEAALAKWESRKHD